MLKKKEFALSKQMLKAGTSIGANIEEALASQSKKDFLHKITIASKEARECNYWLRILRDSRIIEEKELRDIIKESEELIKIITSIAKTTYKKYIK